VTEPDGPGGVLALQMEAVYKTAPASMLSIVGALMALATYWSADMRTGLLVFFACVATVALVHIGSAILRRAGRPTGWTPTNWARLVNAIFLVSGLSWGVGGAWMLGHGNEQQALVICCLALGAVTVTFPAVVYPTAFNLFQASVLVPVAFGLATSSLEYGLILAVGAAMLCAVMALIANGLGEQLMLAMRLSHENEKLARGLEAANRELEIQSLTDPLTGAANRRHLMSFLRAAPARCAVLVVDVDHFKNYNDSFGHADGDVCLVLVAEALQRGARPGVDLVARQGGEEFAIVLVDVSGDDATAHAEALRAEIERLCDARPQQIRRKVTVSIGIAWRGAEERRTIDSLMTEADTAVYEAKKSGRNRVCTGQPGPRSAVA
jgi:diguanylate cyclase (GGDEF)-like protein